MTRLEKVLIPYKPVMYVWVFVEVSVGCPACFFLGFSDLY